MLALAAPAAQAATKSTTLRPGRPARLPAAVAEQPLHRLEHRSPRRGASCGCPRRRRATPRASGSTRSRTRSRDGFSPGSPILTYVPGIDLKRTGAVPLTDLRSYDDKRAPIVADRRADAQAPAVLGRARRRRRQALGPPADDPPGEEPRRGPALHRRAAQPQGQPRAHDQGRARTSRSCARAGCAPSATTRSSARSAGTASQRSSLYLAWDFTIASQRNISERVTSIRDNAFAALGDSNLVDRRIKGAPAGFQARRRPGARAVRRRRLPGGRERPAAAPRLRHADRRLLPRQEGLPARLDVPLPQAHGPLRLRLRSPSAARATRSRCRSRASSRASR